jgi:FkbM family methyltransferase
MFDMVELQAGIDAVGAEARREGVTLFGAGGFARAVRIALGSLGVRVHAHVVTNPQQSRLDGIPVVALNELDDVLKGLPMWLGLFNRNEDSEMSRVARECRSSGVGRVRLPTEYFECIAGPMGWRFWLADRRQYAACRPQIEMVRRMLADEESRRQFDETLRFRLGLADTPPPAPSPDPQYFPPQVVRNLGSRDGGVTFVDGGAYDGDTIGQAAVHLHVRRAFAFEPDPANFGRLAVTAGRFAFPVTCFPCGLSNAVEFLAFSDEAGEGSAIKADGGSRIQCVTLDECVAGEHIDYLKLDVEGHELAALEGARRTVGRDRPVMAIAAYHRWDDLWRIPAFLGQLSAGYLLTYRVHMFNTFDGVFYATGTDAS